MANLEMGESRGLLVLMQVLLVLRRAFGRMELENEAFREEMDRENRLIERKNGSNEVKDLFWWKIQGD